jgi:uncharacterized membrane protein
MTPSAKVLIGMGLGAGLMYLVDPITGNRRRAVLGDKMRRGLRKSADATEVTARDVSNRARGVVAQVRSRISGGRVDDRILEERVRAEVGRACSHPRAIAVAARSGHVTLSGPILASELDAVVSRVAAIPGVQGVANRLEPHADADRISALQGGRLRRARPDFMQTHWSPATRLVTGLGGAGLALWGAWRRSVPGALTAATGLGLAARSATNLELRRLFGLGAGAHAVTVRKNLLVQAPVEQVYAFWSRFERFPDFMANVREVRDLGDGRSRWTVAGPAGVPVEWDASLTNRIPNRELAWATVPGSVIEHSGRVLFLPQSPDATRIDVHLSYAPPGGAIGHGIAWIFGADPKAELDTDLARMKALIERGGSPYPAVNPSSPW